MRSLFLFAAVALPALANAEPATTYNTSPNYFPVVVMPYVPGAHVESPALRQRKLEAAIALKAQAAKLLEADGGTFTRQHEAYIRRKASAILSWDR